MTWAERVIAAWDDANRNMDLKRRLERKANRMLVAWCSRERWDVFWTQTFRRPVSENGAQALWLRYLAERNSRFQCRKMLFVIEPHRNSQSYHVHALLSLRSAKDSTDNETPFGRWLRNWRAWKNESWSNLGKALILPVTDNNAVMYVLKYVTKPGRDISWMEHTPRPATPENLWGVWTDSD